MGGTYPEINSIKISLKSVSTPKKHSSGRHCRMDWLCWMIHSRKCERRRPAGQVAFKLYDTFGLPLDLTAMIAQSRQFRSIKTIPEGNGTAESTVTPILERVGEVAQEEIFSPSPKHSATTIRSSAATTNAVTQATCVATRSLKDPKKMQFVFDQTPFTFYAESGGQISDTGEIVFKGASV